MAVLNFLLVFLLTSVIRAEPAPAVALAFAAETLKNCDASRGKLALEGLDKSDAVLATLYRLAWISRVHTPVPSSIPGESPSDETQLSWKASPEVWRDEWASLARGKSCGTAVEPFLATAEEQKVIGSVLKNAPRDARLDPALTTYLYNEWVEGNETHMPTGTASCQTKAKDLLQAGSVEQRKAWNTECKACEGLFCTTARSRLADELTAEGKYAVASELYLQVLKTLKETPAALHYRAAALQILAGKPLVNQLRATAPLLDLPEAAVPTVQLQAVRNHLCSSIAEMSADRILTLFGQIYPAKDKVRQIRGWISSCSEQEAGQIGRVASLKGLSAAERQIVNAALKLRKSAARNAPGKIPTKSEAGLKLQNKTLPKELTIPVLLPLPQLKWPPMPYQFYGDWQRATS